MIRKSPKSSPSYLVQVTALFVKRRFKPRLARQTTSSIVPSNSSVGHFQCHGVSIRSPGPPALLQLWSYLKYLIGFFCRSFNSSSEHLPASNPDNRFFPLRPLRAFCPQRRYTASCTINCNKCLALDFFLCRIHRCTVAVCTSQLCLNLQLLPTSWTLKMPAPLWLQLTSHPPHQGSCAPPFRNPLRRARTERPMRVTVCPQRLKISIMVRPSN